MNVPFHRSAEPLGATIVMVADAGDPSTAPQEAANSGAKRDAASSGSWPEIGVFPDASRPPRIVTRATSR